MSKTLMKIKGLKGCSRTVLAFSLFNLLTFSSFNILTVQAATAPLEDLPNTAPVVTNEEDAVAMAAVGALGEALSNDVAELSSAFDAKLAGGTNAVMEAMAELRAADSNRIDATYAKLSDIPAQDDLSIYALKSELPQDYLVESDITNFATRAWIASQGYATGAGMTARLDAQDLAIAAASNALWAAHLAEALRLNAASNALAQAIGQESNRLEQARSALDGAWRAGTNALAAAHRTDIAALTSGTNALAVTLRQATNALAQAHRADVLSLRAETATASNALAQAHRADIAALKSGTNTLAVTLRQATNALAQAHAADMAALRTGTNGLDQAWRAGTNALAQAHRADIAALKSGTNTLATTLRQATNALAQAHRTDIAALKSGTNTLATTLRQATNALAQAHRADIAALKSGTNTLATTLRQATNALAIAHRADVAELRRGTNALARADARLEAKIDALELTGGMTRLWSSDATTFQDATGVVWQVHKDWLYTMSGTNYTAEQMGSNFDGGYLSWEEDFVYAGPYGTNEVFTGWFVNDGSGTSPLGYWNEDWSGATNATLTSAQYQFDMQQVVARRAFTNAVTRVAYTNDVAAAIVRLENEGTVRNAERLVDTMTGDSVTVVDVQQIAQAGTNYTDAVASEFENGTRQVQSAMSAGSASDAMVAYKVSGDEWHDQYNANDLMRASTNAAKAVVAPAAVAATNYTDAATNALAQTIGGGGGMPEWREVNYDVEMDTVNYVTNGIASLTFVDSGYAYGLIVSTNGWPEGAAMFVRGSLRAGATYTVPNELRLIGYGTWPTNDFQSVWWRSGTNIFVNILVEE